MLYLNVLNAAVFGDQEGRASLFSVVAVTVTPLDPSPFCFVHFFPVVIKVLAALACLPPAVFMKYDGRDGPSE